MPVNFNRFINIFNFVSDVFWINKTHFYSYKSIKEAWV